MVPLDRNLVAAHSERLTVRPYVHNRDQRFYMMRTLQGLPMNRCVLRVAAWESLFKGSSRATQSHPDSVTGFRCTVG